MDVDKLFRVPKLPVGVKRKLPDNPTPEMLKKMRPDPLDQMDLDGDSHSTALPKRRVTVEDETEDDQDSSFAPGGDADYFAEEDEEGRFYGGGLTSQQKEILTIFERAEGEGVQDEPEEITLPSIRRTLTRFERAVNKNQDQRSKYPDDPTKFIDSEADLDSAIKSLLPLAQSPVLAYPEIIRSGALALLIGLLSHENVDIVIDAVELFNELTDEDVGNEGEDDAEETQATLKVLIEALVDHSILELLVDNLSRLNEAEESDRQGVFHIIGVFENVLGFNPDLSEKLVSQTKIMNWLLERILWKVHDENRCYAAELLSILLQNSFANREELGKKDGVETMLKALSQFRRRDPVDADEAEFMENLFDALCSALSEPQIKSLFLASEGVDLMLLMMKEKLQSKSRSIKVLDYAMSGPAGSEVCSTFVEVLGLKTIFSAFMGKASKKQKRNAGTQATEDTPHILGIISSLFTNLPSDSSGRIRLLAKFVENEYEKVDKLLEVREHVSNRLKQVDAEIEAQKKDLLVDGTFEPEHEDLWYLRRLDGGLFTLQTVDYVLAWIAMEDDGARSHLAKMLERKNLTLENIGTTLRIYRDNVDTDDSGGKSAIGMSQKEILEHLITFLHECS
ncbi:Catenin-beta-like protein [Pisolithus sp. B1]|nr:Catenin-beta-like protein [Pisolithus sp. B1]KAI6106729.1 Catenin-beta-like protein [Pisolithus croceorrhizus]